LATKTYVPGAVDVAHASMKYLSRYQGTLTAGATSQQITALANLIACLATFLQEWHKPAKNP
jgi:hypothetical protein